jgi:fructokinase
VVHQKIVAGRNRIAGEWGHNPLPWPRDEEHPGPACFCGKAGCIETFLSGPALAREYLARSGNALSPQQIALAADSDDAVARRCLKLYMDRLARGLACVVNMLDPDVIVLGGGLSNLEQLYETVPALVADYAFSDGIDTRIMRATHGDSSGVRGAACLWP